MDNGRLYTTNMDKLSNIEDGNDNIITSKYIESDWIPTKYKGTNDVYVFIASWKSKKNMVKYKVK